MYLYEQLVDKFIVKAKKIKIRIIKKNKNGTKIFYFRNN